MSRSINFHRLFINREVRRQAVRLRLTGRLAANGKRRETDLQIVPVRVGSWANETSRSGHF
jgi:hypothetical protein